MSEIGDLTSRRLSDLIARVTSNPSYRDKACWFQKVLRETRGLDVAADIIERVFGVPKEVRTGSFIQSGYPTTDAIHPISRKTENIFLESKRNGS